MRHFECGCEYIKVAGRPGIARWAKAGPYDNGPKPSKPKTFINFRFKEYFNPFTT